MAPTQRFFVVVAAMLCAGCLTPSTDSQHSLADVGATGRPSVQEEANMRALVSFRRDELVDSRIEVFAPKGEWVVVRLILTPPLWNETLPWDGSAVFQYTGSISVDRSANVTFLIGHQDRPVFSSQQERPADLLFLSLRINQSDLFGGLIGTTAFSDREAPRLPAHELAWLVGSEEANVSLSMGIAASEENATPEQEKEAFDNRTAAPIRADARGLGTFAGTAIRMELEGRPYRYVNGAMTLEETVTSPTPAANRRQTRVFADAVVREPGVLRWAVGAVDAQGAERWDHELRTANQDFAYSGTWARPAATLQPEIGLYPSAVSVTHRAEPGPARGSFSRDFWGDTSENQAIAIATWGHASLDPAKVYGWDVQYGARPQSALAPRGAQTDATHCVWMGSIAVCENGLSGPAITAESSARSPTDHSHK